MIPIMFKNKLYTIKKYATNRKCACIYLISHIRLKQFYKIIEIYLRIVQKKSTIPKIGM